jgi:hypothetical protein
MKRNPIDAIQAAVVKTINELGASLLGERFTPVAKSPIPDDDVQRIAGMNRSLHRDPPFYEHYLDAMSDDCPHDSLSGDEGPVRDLGRMPERWRCDECGAIVHDHD